MRPRQHGHAAGNGFCRILSAVRQETLADHGHVGQGRPILQLPGRIHNIADVLLEGFRNFSFSPQNALPAAGGQILHHGMAAFRMPRNNQGRTAGLPGSLRNQDFLPVMRAGGQHHGLATLQLLQNGGKLGIPITAVRRLLVKLDASGHMDDGRRDPHGLKPLHIPLVLHAHGVQKRKIILGKPLERAVPAFRSGGHAGINHRHGNAAHLGRARKIGPQLRLHQHNGFRFKAVKAPAGKPQQVERGVNYAHAGHLGIHGRGMPRSRTGG